jgi:two-component system sensor histidine kinase QseC
VVRQGLNPLNSLAAEIAAVKENNLTARVATGPLPAEILPIKERLNDLLSRLEISFNCERRFTADVAHELRTPLAGIRSTIEVTIKQIRKPGEYQAALSDCLAIAKSMQTMVNNLLTLARIDSNQMTFHRDRIQLAELVNSVWRPFSHKAHERSITFENRLPAEITCNSDPDSLSIIFSNLLDNAAEYTNHDGYIRIETRQINDHIEITIANTGCELTNDQASHVFDCFWRGDSSRTDTGTHCGLGLALVQRIVQALGGSAAAEVLPGGIFSVRVVLPI